MGSKMYNVGTLVEVVFDPLDKLPNHAAKKYNGTRHRIASRKDCGAFGIQFTLEGCVSDKGVPYVFSKNDLFII